MKVSTAFESKIPNQPDSREDNHFVDSENKVFCVLDGMGGEGHENADYSARVAKEGLEKLMKELKDVARDKYLKMLEQGILKLNNNLITESTGKNLELGTTFSYIHLTDDNIKMQFAFVGDSPISIYRLKAKKIERVGLMHNYFLKELVRRGVMDEEGANYIDDFEKEKELKCVLKIHPVLALNKLDRFFSRRGYQNNIYYLLEHYEHLVWEKISDMTEKMWELVQEYHEMSKAEGVPLTFIKEDPLTCETREQFDSLIQNNPEQLLKLIQIFISYGFYHEELFKDLEKWLPLSKNKEICNEVIKDIISIFFGHRNVLDNCVGQENMYVTTGERNLNKGDIILIESDGTSDLLTDEEKQKIIEKCLKDNNFDEVSQVIVDAASEKQRQIDAKEIDSARGKYADDKTVIVIKAR